MRVIVEVALDEVETVEVETVEVADLGGLSRLSL